MPIFAFDHFMLDTERQVLLADGRPAGIRGRPVQILAVLVAKAGEIVTQDEIVAAVWRGVVAGHNNLPVQMSILRRQLRVHGADDVIQALPDQSGYRFAAPVRAVMDHDPPAPTPPPEPRKRRALPWLAICAAGLAILTLGALLRP